MTQSIIKEYPKLLVLSNNSFSKSNSNGRTLGSLLQGWPKDRIAQFCISSDSADFDVCNNYFCVSDGDVLRSILHLHSAQRNNLKSAEVVNANVDSQGKRLYRKTSTKMLLRNIAWNLGLWRGREFNEWVEAFAPQVILLQSGDSFFMHDLAYKLARRTGAKLVVFNTEAPFLFRKNYFRPDASAFEKIVFPLFREIYNCHFKRFMTHCSMAVYGNESLEKDYRNKLNNHCSSCVIYTASELNLDTKPFKKDDIKFSYLGNMGFMRPKALVQVANVLQKLSPTYVLDVYGNPQTVANENLLKTTPGIRFHGVVGYSEVKEIIKNSDFLFHVEYDSPEYAEALKYGFSTKIADSIASKRPFVMFAPKAIAGSEYLDKTGAGIYCSNEDDLLEALRLVISNEEYRNDVIAKATSTAAENHSFDRNTQKMYNAIMSVL